MQSYLKQGRVTWKAIETFVICSVTEGHDYIIEGHQIHPKLAAQLIKKFSTKELRSIFLIKEDIDSIVAGALKNKPKNDWFLKKTKNSETYKKIAAMLSDFGSYIKKEARQYGFSVLVMDNHFDKMLERGIKTLKRGS